MTEIDRTPAEEGLMFTPEKKEEPWIPRRYCDVGSTCQETHDQLAKFRAALEKIADPRKRDHKEPDAYTQLGCVMHIAQEALRGAKS